MPRVWSKRDPNVPPTAIYVGRPTKWGNPFSHLARSQARWRVGSVTEAVTAYERWLHETPEGRQVAADARAELRGADLICWGCTPCHATVLMRVANEEP